MKEKILIADDEPRMLMLIEDFLSSDYELISAKDGKEALDMFHDHPDIALCILDIMMPHKSGLDVLKTIREGHQTPVIILTAKTTEMDELTGFLEGADEYIKKPFSPSILRARVKAILKRSQSTTNITKLGHVHIDEEKAQAFLKDTLLDLSAKEYHLLLHFLKHPSMVFSRNQLLDAIWGDDYVGTDRTVDTTINRLRIKLGPCSYYIETVRGLGYKYEVMDDDH